MHYNLLRALSTQPRSPVAFVSPSMPDSEETTEFLDFILGSKYLLTDYTQKLKQPDN